MTLPRVPRMAWFLWGLVGLVLEIVALLNGREGDTLSALVVYLVPAWFGAAVLGWLAWHFGVGFLQRALGRRPRMR